ncbi:FAD-dependent oxidoreductase, partial [bacterium]|nr:FAD-dependent oxidoreductase [bacterium]
GGQPTSQAVPFDEHPWIEQFGAPRSYRQFRTAIRDYYKDNYPLTREKQNDPLLNPGNGWVSRIGCEPRVVLAVLENLFAPYISNRQLTLLLEHRPIAADVDGDRVASVTVEHTQSNNKVALSAPYFIDATEMGDLLPLTMTEYVTGFEAQSDTGEELAPSEAQPANMQAVTWCFVMDYLNGEDHTIEKPEQYDYWKDYVPPLTPPWPGKLFSFKYSAPHKPDNVRELGFDPSGNTMGWFNYRRIIDDANYAPGAYQGDAAVVNWPQNDYLEGNLFDVSEEDKAKHWRGAHQLSLSLMYWLQTEAPRPDGGAGWPGLRLRGDLTGTEHGLAMYPYIRESRRIRAEFTVVAEHVWADARSKAQGVPLQDATAVEFSDTVGVGSYRIDLHPSTGGDNYVDLSTCPFQVPLGAMIPQRMENLIPACKNIGTTHLTNGTYRLHPVEWNIGESAGALVAYCLSKGEPPRGVRNKENLLKEFQSRLRSQGVELEWPRIRPR